MRFFASTSKVLTFRRSLLDFKKFTSRYLKPNSYPDVTLWRARYDDVPVPGPKAASTRLEYMHANPIRHELVTLAEEYPWSSARDYAGSEKGIVTVTLI